nr:MAG TPA: hypothetical protein [Caudoviricetes sp.]
MRGRHGGVKDMHHSELRTTNTGMHFHKFVCQA